LIQKYGYPVEEHTVKTEDGYLLTHFRIPHGRAGASARRRGPVILQHGMASASDTWILMGPERSLGNVSSAAVAESKILSLLITNPAIPYFLEVSSVYLPFYLPVSVHYPQSPSSVSQIFLFKNCVFILLNVPRQCLRRVSPPKYSVRISGLNRSQKPSLFTVHKTVNKNGTFYF